MTAFIKGSEPKLPEYMKTQSEDWEKEFDEKCHIELGAGFLRFPVAGIKGVPTLEPRAIKQFIRKQILKARISQISEDIYPENEKLVNMDNKPVSDFTRGYNRAVDDMNSNLEEKKALLEKELE